MTLLLVVLGCAQPTHLQYDFGRAYMEAASLQANLDRPSVANAVYELSGTEGVQLRENVEASTTEQKSGKAETTESVSK